MHRTLVIACSLALFSLAAATPALAGPASCANSIIAEGRMPNGLNFEPPRHYDAQVHARARAISAWQAKAHAVCGRRYSYWPLAHAKNVSCEGYAGGVECRARAVPAL